jgi:DDE_Tnp_1-associated
VSVECRPLIEVLAQVPDFRQASGKRHALPALLALACAGLLCGYRSYGAMAEWGRNYGAELAQALGFNTGKTPCAATFYNVFKGLDRAALEDVLGQWAHSVLQTMQTWGQVPAATTAATTAAAMALDGKTLRGSARAGAPEAHLLSVVSHQLGLTLLQVAVEKKTNEIGAVQEVLHKLILEGHILTVDALLTQREVAQTIVTKGGTT